jgi:isocitrate dehydrogenase
MFEAIHGSAPTIAGKNLANPSGLLHGAIQMLTHIGQSDVAIKVHNAWLKTIEDGIHTFDIYKEGVSQKNVGTKEFAEAIIKNIGHKPSQLKEVNYTNNSALKLPKYQRKTARNKELQGVDIFVHWNGDNANELASILQLMNTSDVQLDMITNRGIKVFPDGFPETFFTDHWRCRFKSSVGKSIDKKQIIQIMQTADDNSIDIIKTENLYAFDGKTAYSLGQGQ